MTVDMYVIMALAGAWVISKIVFWAGLLALVKGVLNSGKMPSL